MKLDITEIEKRIDAGLIRRQWSDDGELQILNYTHKCQYARAWDYYTVLTRGLVLTKDGTIAARSFRKFWNLNEPPGPALQDLPKEDPVITLKLDGFLGLTYAHNGTIKIASRGSFTSEYAQWATEWLHKNNPDCALSEYALPDDYTFVFEILYPNRRIVVDNSSQYGLVLLAGIHNETGVEMPRMDLENIGRLYRWSVVPVSQTHSINECVELAKTIKGTEQEGFVAHYPNSGIRVKVKGDDYCKIHRIATKLTSKRVWEALKDDHKIRFGDNLPLGLLSDIAGILPREYALWLTKTVDELTLSHDEILKEAGRCLLQLHLNNIGVRKDQAKYASERFNHIFAVIMAMLDNRHNKASKIAWDLLKPVHKTPIIRDGEDE